MINELFPTTMSSPQSFVRAWFDLISIDYFVAINFTEFENEIFKDIIFSLLDNISSIKTP